MVDRVGRLQLPVESVEKLGLSGRARVEVVEDGVVIKPRSRRE